MSGDLGDARVHKSSQADLMHPESARAAIAPSVHHLSPAAFMHGPVPAIGVPLILR
jgi:hypothetical protein